MKFGGKRCPGESVLRPAAPSDGRRVFVARLQYSSAAVTSEPLGLWSIKRRGQDEARSHLETNVFLVWPGLVFYFVCFDLFRLFLFVLFSVFSLILWDFCVFSGWPGPCFISVGCFRFILFSLFYCVDFILLDVCFMNMVCHWMFFVVVSVFVFIF